MDMEVVEVITAIATAVMALGALVISITEGRAARQHNRLSVRPYLTVRHHLSGRRGMLGIAASNDGLGPALVTACAVEVDGTAMEEEDGDNGWNAALKALGIHDSEFAIETIAPKGTIPAGGTVWLLCTPYRPDKVALRDNMKAAVRRLDVRLSYESMYRGDNLVANYRTEAPGQPVAHA